MPVFYAHSREEEPDKSKWQVLEDHLRNTANLAREFADAWEAGDWGYLAGLWHDIGKYSSEFQAKICAVDGEDAHIETSKRVDHSTAGTQHAHAHLGDAGKVIAYAIAGHHGGIPDGISTESCLKSRLEKQIPDYHNCPSHILKSSPLALSFVLSSDRAAIQLSLFVRMLYSSLVDADFLDTEAFLNPEQAEMRRGYRPLSELADGFFSKLDELSHGAKTNPVNQARSSVLNQCLQASCLDTGLFSLTVPTGGGKTLSSMAFALKHALKYGLKRVIYVIPYTSIIEQNAAVFRAMLGEDAVLEHHSNFEAEQEDHRSRLACENWDAPVVVTTNVQFFESLFANRSSRCRKLHNIAESVVILDEVQTIPADFLLPCLETLKELSETYRVSIVLCSATQPAVLKRSDFAAGLEGVREIVGEPQKLANTMRRTAITVLPQVADQKLADRLGATEQVLCIVNTRSHARHLFQAMEDTEGLYHLSALMCPIHRGVVLDEIRRRLQEGKRCRVVSTQLIEAGVDIDFPVVFRSMAGIDSIAQAAGRCNREGKLEKGDVFVFTPETLAPPGHLRQAAQAGESVVRRHQNDIQSLAAIEDYFKMYYWTKGDALDAKNVLSQLQEGCLKGDFPFKSIAEVFQLIDDYKRPVVIPFDNRATNLIRSLDFVKSPRVLARRLQRYTVSIPPFQWDRLLTLGSIEMRQGIYPVLVDTTLYDDRLGLSASDPVDRTPGDLLV